MYYLITANEERKEILKESENVNELKEYGLDIVKKYKEKQVDENSLWLGKDIFVEDCKGTKVSKLDNLWEKWEDVIERPRESYTAKQIISLMDNLEVFNEKLTQKVNHKTNKKEYVLVSKKTNRPLKYFGSRKPSKESVEKEERRIQYFKNK